MNKPSKNSWDWQVLFTGEYVIYWGIIWSTIALLLYLTFSVVEPGTTRPIWFILTTTWMEQVSLIVAGCLCWRNWRSSCIPSGKWVWLFFAIAIFAFGFGNLWFCLWEVLWGLDPAASAGNPWFVLFYLMLIAGVRLAILDREIQLPRQQWLMVLSVATCGLIIGCWLTTTTAKAELLPQTVTPIVNVQQGTVRRERINLPVVTPSHPLTPQWVLEVDRTMQPLVTSFNLFYILCDLVLLIFATILLLGFWGGNLSLPWRTIAQAVFCFYIADTWFAYASNRVQGYTSGSIMEVFWIFGIVQFGIAAALEFDNSIRSRRLDRRRTAIK